MDANEELLTRGVEKIYPSKDTLEKVLRSGQKLRLYQGFDPTGTLLHIGHMVGLMKLRQFQDLGHHVIFLIGDGTGQAGDPSGRTTARERFLTRDQLRENAKDYVLQAKKIVRFSGENPAEILYNSDWLNKLTLVDILTLLDKFSLQQLLERDIFEKRMKEGKRIGMREFIYPLLQGYDSVAMKVDLEIGGTDQTFNMLTGRQMVKEMLGKEKFVMTLPLLTDARGRKIGKTEGNVIALTTKPSDLYGMIMNLPDDVVIKCFELITDIPRSEIKIYREALAKGENPIIYKKKLAFTLVRMLNDEKEAESAQQFFEETFQEKKLPAEIPNVEILAIQPMTLVDLVMKTKLVTSRGMAKRLIKEGAVEAEGKKLTDPLAKIKIKEGMVLRVGKHRFAKIIKNTPGVCCTHLG